MLGLRLAEGVSLSTLAKQFGEKTLEQIWTCLRPYHRQGWVVSGQMEYPDAREVELTLDLKLTDPEGFLFQCCFDGAGQMS